MARSILLAVLLAIGMATAGAVAGDRPNVSPVPASESDGVLAEGIIVRLNPDLGDVIQQVIDLIETLLPGSEIVVMDSFDGRYWLRVPAGAPVDFLLDQLNASNLIEYVSLNYINEYPERGNLNSFAWGGEDDCPLSGPDAWQDQPAWQAMAFEQAHQISTAEDTIVAVIDSGVWHDHPVMQGRIHPASADLLDDGDAHGEALAHGTHVAGIVALAAPGTSILDLRVLDKDGMGHDFYTAKAVWMAVNAGAQVINLSLGSKASFTEQAPILADVFDHAAEHGVLIAGAAGNLGEGIDLEPGERQYPAAEQCALGIAAVDSALELADFSNLGEWVSFSAPGEMIYSTLHEDSEGSGWGCWKGTSMATPFVSATAALMRGANPAVTTPDIAAYLAYTSTPSGADETAYGLISPAEAVARAADHEAVPVFSPANECGAYHVQPPEQDPTPPVSGSDDASEHQASGIELSADIAVLELLDDGLAAGPVPALEASDSLPFAHRESLLELDLESPLGLIELSSGPLALDALFGGPSGPSVTAAGVAELALAVRLLDILNLGDLLEVSLSADAVESSAVIAGECGDLEPIGNTQIANGTLTAALLGAVGVPLPVEAAPLPNTGIDLDVLGLAGSTLYLNEQTIGGDGVMESSIQVNALRLALDVNIEIVVPVATVTLELIVGQASASRNCNEVDLEVTLAADPDPGIQGGELTYNASATNAGSEVARGARAIFTRPDAAEFISASAPGGCVQTRFNEMTCVLGDINPAATAEAVVLVTPHLAGEVLSRLEVNSAELETGPENNAVELVTTIQGSDAFNSIFSDRFEHAE